jgi:sugar phosphate isomerase/epimerase
MLKVAAFADEISPDLDVQIEHCKKNGVTHFELRGVAGKNVLDFNKPLRDEIKRKLSDSGLGVASIGSPIGKVKIHQSWDAHFDRFKIAVDMAEFFGAPLIRVFSYYPADGQSHADFVKRHRDEVMNRFHKKIEYLKGRKPILVHENEANIYGEKGRECLDLHKTLDCPQFKAAFDFANFVQAGEDPLQNWPLLKPYTAHIHIKDAKMGTGKVMPAGQGDGHLREILADAYASGYRGFLSLEPHLAKHEQLSGFSGPELFKVAADALRQVAKEAGVPLAW